MIKGNTFFLQIFLFFFFSIQLSTKSYSANIAQDDKFRVPLNLAISLSGNYGELRSTHFHSGIDLRVGGVSGAPVYSAMDGYVSRISVSSGGYGHAIYINHPNGTTTLYGHLMNFAPAVAKWVEEMQYNKKSFQVNLYPDSLKFPVKKGDLIGNAGNTGSSGGPHLHFEIRETERQIPLNPVTTARFNIPDKTPPQIRRVNIYSLQNARYLPESTLLSSYNTQPKSIVSVPDTFYVAVDAVDRMEGTYAKLAIHNYSFFLDDTLIYSFTPDKIPFDKGKYINSVVEYSEKQKYGISMVKSFVEPGNGLRQNITSRGDGLFTVTDDSVHTVRVVAADISGNIAEWSFKVKATLEPPVSVSIQTNDNQQIMPWYLPNRFQTEDILLTLPTGSLYRSIIFEAEIISTVNGRVWCLGNPEVPLHNQAKLSITLPGNNFPAEKIFIGRQKESGDLQYCGGEWKEGRFETSISSFGKYLISLDTIPPVVVPHFKRNQNLSGRNSLKFTVKDDVSGIDICEVKIDGEWVLYNHDPKSNSLTVKLNPLRIKKGVSHELEISVTDNRKNVTSSKTWFVW